VTDDVGGVDYGALGERGAQSSTAREDWTASS